MWKRVVTVRHAHAIETCVDHTQASREFLARSRNSGAALEVARCSSRLAIVVACGSKWRGSTVASAHQKADSDGGYAQPASRAQVFEASG